MYKYLEQRFALSEEGARTFVKGVFWTAWHYISLMLPLSFTFLFLMEYIKSHPENLK